LDVGTPAVHRKAKRPDIFLFDELGRQDWPACTETSSQDGMTGFRAAGYKYIAAAEGDELYQLDSDPAELRNLAAEQPETLARMRAKLSEWQANLIPYQGPEPFMEDQEFLARLKAAGYL